mmetsp:Transcript_6406/g.9357  ORF Transcript_6406/g.9357 Transcript_6406/m.9357 type:complete len:93 (+) Transcript_6406:145-423(+)
MSGWVLEKSSSSVEEVPHGTSPPLLMLPIPPPDPQVVPAIKEDEDSVRFVYRRDEGVDGPVEISNDIARLRLLLEGSFKIPSNGLFVVSSSS